MLLLETVYANSICPKDQTLLWGNMVSTCLTSLKNSTTDFLSTRLIINKLNVLELTDIIMHEKYRLHKILKVSQTIDTTMMTSDAGR